MRRGFRSLAGLVGSRLAGRKRRAQWAGVGAASGVAGRASGALARGAPVTGSVTNAAEEQNHRPAGLQLNARAQLFLGGVALEDPLDHGDGRPLADQNSDPSRSHCAMVIASAELVEKQMVLMLPVVHILGVMMPTTPPVG